MVRRLRVDEEGSHMKACSFDDPPEAGGILFDVWQGGIHVAIFLGMRYGHFDDEWHMLSFCVPGGHLLTLDRLRVAKYIHSVDTAS